MTRSKLLTPQNIGASVRARLLNISKYAHQDYNSFLIRYAQERFLFRLSSSKYKDKFILKGASLLLPYRLPMTRPTKDVDFLGRHFTNDPAIIKRVIQEIVSIDANDGVKFASSKVRAEQIAEQENNPGVRCHLLGKVGGVAFSLQLDIGFGDKIIPRPVEMNFPVLTEFGKTLVTFRKCSSWEVPTS